MKLQTWIIRQGLKRIGEVVYIQRDRKKLKQISEVQTWIEIYGLKKIDMVVNFKRDRK